MLCARETLVTQLLRVIRTCCCVSLCSRRTHNRAPPRRRRRLRGSPISLSRSAIPISLEIAPAIHFNRVRPPIRVSDSVVGLFPFRMFVSFFFCHCAPFPPICFAAHRNPPRSHTDLSSMLYARVRIRTLHGEYPEKGASFVEGAASSNAGSPPMRILTTKPADTSELLISHFLSAREERSSEDIKLAILYRRRRRRTLDSQTRANIDYRPGSFFSSRGDSRYQPGAETFSLTPPPPSLLIMSPRRSSIARSADVFLPMSILREVNWGVARGESKARDFDLVASRLRTLNCREVPDSSARF